jgi:hypothetical protein
MSIESAIYTLLAADTDLTDLVSTRIYDDAADQNPTLPYLTVFRVSEPHTHEMQGAAGMTHPRMQIDVFAENGISRFATTEAVREALDGYRGTSDSVVISKCFLVNRFDQYEDPVEGERFGTWRSTMDFEISHAESVPTF